ncbi:MAG: hypothetical protein QOD24_2710, partial [Solirubrobacteraceae bacterium]|nr:hypothetical protein [Solirubrobacteraceae bacterium]
MRACSASARSTPEAAQNAVTRRRPQRQVAGYSKVSGSPGERPACHRRIVIDVSFG